ncbi:hypothetical protein OIU74_004270 [Salix koriyanagi]|uniref:Uncharacterized protein n=1 Tax=Salix koriyanagi TaxID=2511006 RepID=A0A9Q0V0H8_9ROSI|nr:hypothetical protein OIU74_004270 [Salix koriyanagi]
MCNLPNHVAAEEFETSVRRRFWPVPNQTPKESNPLLKYMYRMVKKESLKNASNWRFGSDVSSQRALGKLLLFVLVKKENFLDRVRQDLVFLLAIVN